MALVLVAASMLSLVVTAGPAVANGPPEVFTETFTADDITSPCTGNVVDAHFVQTVRLHIFELNDPDRHHINLVAVTTELETTDGFSGKQTETFVDNGAGLLGQEEGRGLATNTVTGTVRDGSGQLVLFHVTFHVTLVGGEPVVELDRVTFECLGKPS